MVMSPTELDLCILGLTQLCLSAVDRYVYMAEILSQFETSVIHNSVVHTARK